MASAKTSTTKAPARAAAVRKPGARSWTSAPAKTVDDYLARVPEEMRAALEKLRRDIRKAAPDAVEVLSYQVPAYRTNKMLVSFGAAKSHCAFYVMSTAVMDAYKDELAGYATGKGSIQFAPEAPLPTALVMKLVKARVAENERKG